MAGILCSAGDAGAAAALRQPFLGVSSLVTAGRHDPPGLFRATDMIMQDRSGIGGQLARLSTPQLRALHRACTTEIILRLLAENLPQPRTSDMAALVEATFAANGARSC
jgi:hypothetical protein